MVTKSESRGRPNRSVSAIGGNGYAACAFSALALVAALGFSRVVPPTDVGSIPPVLAAAPAMDWADYLPVAAQRRTP